MDRFATMQTFLMVVDTGSFSSAARRLNVGQPAVSKTIAQLEGRLGVKLLVRSTRGLSPTEAGLNFYERARRSVEEAEEADLAARGAGAGLSGKLRVCAAVTFWFRTLNWKLNSSSTTGTLTSCKKASTSPFGWDRCRIPV
jgi:DNA-binding transcriptional LysR family regulator